MLVLSICIAIVVTLILCILYMKLLKIQRSKYVKECVNWGCKHPGQICRPERLGADNQAWICDGATWYQLKAPETEMKDK